MKSQRIEKRNYNKEKFTNTSNDIKGFILFALMIMISLTILFIIHKMILNITTQYNLHSKQETFLYILTALILVIFFIYTSST
jgi:hypothetical protein